MGTAPERQHPAMPDPARLVTRSLRLLTVMGMTDVEALETIAGAARTVRFRVTGNGTGSSNWVTKVAADAEDRLAVLTPSQGDSIGGDHGDGQGSQ